MVEGGFAAFRGLATFEFHYFRDLVAATTFLPFSQGVATFRGF